MTVTIWLFDAHRHEYLAKHAVPIQTCKSCGVLFLLIGLHVHGTEIGLEIRGNEFCRDCCPPAESARLN